MRSKSMVGMRDLRIDKIRVNGLYPTFKEAVDK
jgi:hypothetical protein